MTMCLDFTTTTDPMSEGSVTIPVSDYNKLRDELAKKEEALLLMDKGGSVKIDSYGNRYVFPEDEGVSQLFSGMRGEIEETAANLEYWRGKVKKHNAKPWWKRMAKIEVRR